MIRGVRNLFIVLCFTLISSCKIQVESKILLSSFLTLEPSAVQIEISAVSQTCETRFGTFDFENKRCERGNTTTLYTHISKFPDVSGVSSDRVNLFFGKNGTLIVYIRADTLEDISSKLSKQTDNVVVKIRINLVNDTKREVRVGVSNVWVGGNLPLGREQREFYLRSGESVSVDLSDSSVAGLLNEGLEPLVFIAID